MLIYLIIGFAIGVEVFVFAMLPYFYQQILSKKIINAFNNFSAGLFLGIVFFHIIPEANEAISKWQYPERHLRYFSEQQKLHQFPAGSFLTLIAFLMVLWLEVYINDGLCKQEINEKRNNNHMHNYLSNEKMKIQRRLMFETYFTQFALSIHSFFECMSIGTQRNEKVLWTVAGAIFFHKWVESLTLGFLYSISGIKKQTAIKFALFHAFLNFFAVLIGYRLNEASQLVKGITNAISGGTFIYFSMIEKISKNFQNREELFQKIALLIGGICFSVMILH